MAWTAEQDCWLLEHIYLYPNKVELSEEFNKAFKLNKPYHTVRGRANTLAKAQLPKPSKASLDMPLPTTYEISMSDWVETGATTSQADIFLNVLDREFSHILENNHIRLPPLSDKLKVEGTSIAALALSDIHMGAVVKDHENNIVYNSDICEQRLKSIPEQMFKLKPPKQHNSCLIAVIGDLITGSRVYKNQQTEIDLCLGDQITTLVPLLHQLFLELADKYTHVEVLMVDGNHDSMSPYHATMSNFSHIIMRFLQYLLHQTVVFNIAIRYKHAVASTHNILGHKIMIRHKGVPQEQTPARKGKIGVWQYKHRFDLMISGHFHTLGLGDYCGIPHIRNGSFKPPGDFEERLGLWGKCRQAVWTITTEKPVNSLDWIEWS